MPSRDTMYSYYALLYDILCTCSSDISTTLVHFTIRKARIRWDKLQSNDTKVDGFDTFLSHTWLTAGRWKVLTLLLRSGWHMMLLGWVLGVTIAVVLCILDVLPMISLWTFIFGIPAAFLGLFGSLYIPNQISRSQICFLDVVSIHQTDAGLMERGIYGLGGFLKVAKELRVLWSRPYLSRLWCLPNRSKLSSSFLMFFLQLSTW